MSSVAPATVLRSLAAVPEEAPVGAQLGDAFAELRGLLFSEEQLQLEHLRRRIEEPLLRTEDVSRVLVQAIALHTAEGSALTAALTPKVEAAIASSIRRDPQVLADSIFPIMGSAIRKSIAAALQSMTQSLDLVLAHSFSVQGLKWRLEAKRSGRPFAEIVLLHTLLYRVEQVFLIDRRTGLLLQHAAATDVVVQDPDLVSGMLTAILDFVRDSFNSTQRETLDALQVGELVVWIEQGPLAVLAGVIRGTPPQTLRNSFRLAIERIHQAHGAALQAFDGDADALAAALPQLQSCLEAHYGKPATDGDAAAPPKRGLSPLAIVGAGLALLIVVPSFMHFRHAWRWDGYVEQLRDEPGIVVTEAVKRGGLYRVSGLRDALAADPQALLLAAGLDAQDVRFAWEPYLSLRPELLGRRAAAQLAPPATVQLRMHGQTLVADGVAPRAWVQAARLGARGLPGIAAFDSTRLAVAEDLEWPALRDRIDATVLLARAGAAQLAPGQEALLARLSADLRQLGELARSSGGRARLEIVGHTDLQGSQAANLRLSRARADALLGRLAALQIAGVELVASGVGAHPPRRETLTPAVAAQAGAQTLAQSLAQTPAQASAQDRRVSFKAFLSAAAAPTK